MFSRNYLFLLYTIPYLIRIDARVHPCVRQSAQKRLEPFQPICMHEPALTKQSCGKNRLLERSGYTKEEWKKESSSSELDKRQVLFANRRNIQV